MLFSQEEFYFQCMCSVGLCLLVSESLVLDKGNKLYQIKKKTFFCHSIFLAKELSRICHQNAKNQQKRFMFILANRLCYV